MIDNVEIVINGIHNKPSLKSFNWEFKIYYLHFDDNDSNEYYLQIRHNKQRKTLSIVGSIRKWYLGMFSLSDLNERDFVNAIKRIAFLLNIDYEKILEAKICNCEIGLNIRTRIPADKVNEVVRSYSNYKYFRYAFETVGFIGVNKKLKLYDKCTELLTRYGKYDKNGDAKKKFNELKKSGEYIYRIEFTLFDKRSFDLEDLSDLQSINGLINNYPELIRFWVNECTKIDIGMSVNFEDERITKDEYAILTGIYNLGYHIFINEYSKRSIVMKNNKGKKNGQSALNAISIAKKEVNDVYNKYQNIKLYAVKHFRLDVFRSVYKLYKHNTNVDMREVVFELLKEKKK